MEAHESQMNIIMESFAHPRGNPLDEFDYQDDRIETKNVCYCEPNGKVHKAWKDVLFGIEEKVARYEIKHCSKEGE